MAANRATRILNAKLAPPRISRTRVIERTRFAARREQAWDLACVCVVAPPGFGKTTLLAQWHAHALETGRIAAWLTCEEADQDVGHFARHLVSALSLAFPEMAGRLERLADSVFGLDGEAVGASILAALEHSDAAMMVMVDDWHHAESVETTALLGVLVNHAPDTIHVVISSRKVPALPLTKLRASGEVMDIRSTDLGFAPEESREVVRHQVQREPAEEALELIATRTEGWPIGVRLAAMALAERPDLPVRQLLSGREPGLHGYLREEVFSQLPPDLAAFIGDTAQLREFSAELADHVRDACDSAALIGLIEERQFFIMPLGEPGWYRYHPLFVEAFAERTAGATRQRQAEVHLKAAEWLEANGLVDRALTHADASGEAAALAGLLARHSQAMAHTGRSSPLLRFARHLPQDLLQDHPDLQLDRIYAATLTWQFSEATRVLDEVRATLQDDRRVARWEAAGLDIRRIERKLIHREVQLLLLQDRMPKVEGLARQWEAMEGRCTAFEDAVNRTTLIYAQRELFDFANLSVAPAAREIFESEENDWATIWHDCIIGASHAQRGDLPRAERMLFRGLYTAEGLYGRANSTTAMPALYLAEIKFEKNETDQAKALIDEFLPLATRTGLVDQLVAGFLTQARLAALRDPDEGLRILETADEIAGSRQFDRLRAFVLAERLRILAGAGEHASLRRVAMLHGVGREPDRLKPRQGMATADVARALAAAQLALVENELQAAEGLLARWLQFLTMRQSNRLAIPVALALAHAQLVAGETNAAHRSLRQALLAGEPGGFVRSYLDVNPAVRNVLVQMRIDGDPTLAAHLARVVEASGLADARPRAAIASANDAQFEALNDREAEILLMISTGMMNKQIASDLGLTLGTVKWYLQQIYAKMGVNRRSEAVFKARQLGLIA